MAPSSSALPISAALDLDGPTGVVQDPLEQLRALVLRELLGVAISPPGPAAFVLLDGPVAAAEGHGAEHGPRPTRRCPVCGRPGPRLAAGASIRPSTGIATASTLRGSAGGAGRRGWLSILSRPYGFTPHVGADETLSNSGGTLTSVSIYASLSFGRRGPVALPVEDSKPPFTVSAQTYPYTPAAKAAHVTATGRGRRCKQ